MIYARELQEEMVRSSLTRKLLAHRHGVSLDRITRVVVSLDLFKDEMHPNRDVIYFIGDYQC